MNSNIRKTILNIPFNSQLRSYLALIIRAFNFREFLTIIKKFCRPISFCSARKEFTTELHPPQLSRSKNSLLFHAIATFTSFTSRASGPTKTSIATQTCKFYCSRYKDSKSATLILIFFFTEETFCIWYKAALLNFHYYI